MITIMYIFVQIYNVITDYVLVAITNNKIWIVAQEQGGHGKGTLAIYCCARRINSLYSTFSFNNIACNFVRV